MRMAIVSPTYHAGSTTIVGLLGAILSNVQKQTVTMLYTGVSRTLPELFGAEIGDPTMSSDILSNFLASRVITEEDLKLYSLIIADDLRVLDVGDGAITEDASNSLVTYAFRRASDDIVLCDLNAPLCDKVSQDILQDADSVALVINPDNAGYASAKRYIDSGLFKKENTILIVNRYHEQIDSLRHIAKKVGIPYNHTCKLHFNPQLAKACNAQRVAEVAKQIYSKAPEVLVLNNDLKELTQYIASITGLKFIWG